MKQPWWSHTHPVEGLHGPHRVFTRREAGQLTAATCRKQHESDQLISAVLQITLTGVGSAKQLSNPQWSQAQLIMLLGENINVADGPKYTYSSVHV